MDFIKTHMNIIIELTVILIITLLSLKLTDFFTEKIKKNILIQNDNKTRIMSFLPLINKIIKIIILFLFIATILQKHGYSITTLIAGFGITGLAVGFAAKETIANVFGSLAILYDKIFNIGDYIIIDNIVEGTVEDINLRSTKIRTIKNEEVTVPNNIVANTHIKNISAINYRQLEQTFRITYGTPHNKIIQAIDIINDIVCSNTEFSDKTKVFLDTLDSSSINIKLISYIKYSDIDNLRRIKQNILIDVYKRFNEEGIEFAYPTQTLYLKNEN